MPSPLGEQKRLERCGTSNEGRLRKVEILLQQLHILAQRYRVLDRPLVKNQKGAVALLKAALEQKERRLVRGLFQHLVAATTVSSQFVAIARSVAGLAPQAVRGVLSEQLPTLRQQLHPQLLSHIQRFAAAAPTANEIPPAEMNPGAIAKSLKAFADDLDPLTQAVGMYLLSEIDFASSQEVARQLQESAPQLNRIVAEMVETLLEQDSSKACPLEACPTTFHTVEKLVCLGNCEFFRGIRSETLIELSYRSRVLTYGNGEEIVGSDAASRELLLLLEGDATIETQGSNGQVETSCLVSGKAIDELEVAGPPGQSGKITAVTDGTRVLAVPVDAFDDLMDGDPDFARRVVNLESRHLQQLLQIG